VTYWRKFKLAFIALMVISFTLTLAPSLVNWHLVINQYPHAMDEYIHAPVQQIGVFKGLSLGLQGKLLPAPDDILSDPIKRISAAFPDLWTFKLIQHSRSGLIAGLMITLFLISLGGWSLYKFWNSETEIQIPDIKTDQTTQPRETVTAV
jgi:hypothetical protein